MTSYEVLSTGIHIQIESCLVGEDQGAAGVGKTERPSTLIFHSPGGQGHED